VKLVGATLYDFPRVHHTLQHSVKRPHRQIWMFARHDGQDKQKTLKENKTGEKAAILQQ